MVCLLTQRSCVLENQTIVFVAAGMSDLVVIGDYELLEKKREEYERD